MVTYVLIIFISILCCLDIGQLQMIISQILLNIFLSTYVGINVRFRLCFVFFNFILLAEKARDPFGVSLALTCISYDTLSDLLQSIRAFPCIILYEIPFLDGMSR